VANFELAESGEVQSEAIDINVGGNLGHDAINDRVDYVVSQTLSVFLISSLRFLVRSNQLLVT
jgi:hypothetical protein